MAELGGVKDAKLPEHVLQLREHLQTCSKWARAAGVREAGRVPRKLFRTLLLACAPGSARNASIYKRRRWDGAPIYEASPSLGRLVLVWRQAARGGFV